MLYTHIPVLLDEVLDGLQIKPEGIYLDATFGRGGHSLEILQRLGPHGRLLVMDKDPAAIKAAEEGPFRDARLCAVRATFSELAQVVQSRSWHGKINGILMDLGVSSPQLDDPERGFSILHDGPLDMRMNPDTGFSAADWINHAAEKEIQQILRQYGEERFAKRIAKAILSARLETPILRTRQLKEIIAAAVPAREHHKHPATRSFQGIRIFINQELDELKATLDQCLAVLAPGGRLNVISFHSLEDRIVKRFIQREVEGEKFPPDLPIVAKKIQSRLRKINGLIRPSEAEIRVNPRARSARLRIAEKIL